jgi:hypothetical protein
MSEDTVHSILRLIGKVVSESSWPTTTKGQPQGLSYHAFLESETQSHVLQGMFYSMLQAIGKVSEDMAQTDKGTAVVMACLVRLARLMAATGADEDGTWAMMSQLATSAGLPLHHPAR